MQYHVPEEGKPQLNRRKRLKTRKSGDYSVNIPTEFDTVMGTSNINYILYCIVFHANQQADGECPPLDAFHKVQVNFHVEYTKPDRDVVIYRHVYST
jgi:hypothetical protein